MPVNPFRSMWRAEVRTGLHAGGGRAWHRGLATAEETRIADVRAIGTRAVSTIGSIDRGGK